MNVYRKLKVSKKKAKAGDLLQKLSKLKKKSISIGVDNKLRGFASADVKHREIRINRNANKATHVKGELGDSVLHEINHIRFPRLGEKKIIQKTKRNWAQMSQRSKQKLYSLIR